MSNKLKNIFSTDKPVYKGTLKFNNDEGYKKFRQALKVAFDKEESVPINGINKIETYIETSAGKQMLFEDDKMLSFFVAPSFEDIPYKVKTDYGDYTFNFKKLIKENVLVIKNEKSSVIHIRIEFKRHSDTLSYTYNFKPNLANNFETIVRTYNATIHLMQKLFKPTSEIKETINSMKRMELFWKHVVDLEKLLNITFIPSDINGSIEDMNKIEELYISLIKNIPIRQNLNDIQLTVNKDENLNFEEVAIGQEIKIGLVETLDYKIYGASFSIYTISLFFNLYVDSIRLDKNGQEYIITCNSIDNKPIYKSSLAFLTKEQAQVALGESDKYRSALLNAKSLHTLTKEFQSSDNIHP